LETAGNPTHKGAIFDSGQTILSAASSIYVSGKYAYVASASGAMEILNISNPISPQHVSVISDSLVNPQVILGTAWSIFVSGQYAYVSALSDDGVEIIDISDPANPTLKGAIFDSNASQCGAGGVNCALQSASDVYVSGKYAYVTSYGGDNGVEILDISGIDAPTASIGNISVSNATITDNMDVGNNLYIRNGLNVGPGGIKSDGVIQATSTEAFRIKLPLSSPGACGSSYAPAGSIYFNTTLSEPCFCNGTIWTQFDGGGVC
jgi:hypothetical protein